MEGIVNPAALRSALEEVANGVVGRARINEPESEVARFAANDLLKISDRISDPLKQRIKKHTMNVLSNLESSNTETIYDFWWRYRTLKEIIERMIVEDQEGPLAEQAWRFRMEQNRPVMPGAR